MVSISSITIPIATPHTHTHEGGIQEAFCLLTACLISFAQRLSRALEIKEHSGCIEMKTCAAKLRLSRVLQTRPSHVMTLGATLVRVRERERNGNAHGLLMIKRTEC